MGFAKKGQAEYDVGFQTNIKTELAMSIVLLQLPEVKNESESRPKVCPYCQWQQSRVLDVDCVSNEVESLMTFYLNEGGLITHEEVFHDPDSFLAAGLAP